MNARDLEFTAMLSSALLVATVLNGGLRQGGQKTLVKDTVSLANLLVEELKRNVDARS